MLDVFFWGLNQEQGTSTPHGNCMCLWSLVQNPRRSQGISRLFSQSPERTLEKKKKKQKNICFQNIFPSSNSKEGHSAALLGFFTFVWLASWAGGHGEQGSFHLWVTGWHPSWIRSSSIHVDGDSRTPHLNDTGQGTPCTRTLSGTSCATVAPQPRGAYRPMTEQRALPGALVNDLRTACLFHQRIRDVSTPSVIFYG